MREARYYSTMEGGQIRCNLCPHYCVLGDGGRGLCLGRANLNDRLVSENYGKVTALNLDPIEKKPLYHFFPGSQILTVGSFGCNLQCSWCQNCEISRRGLEAFSQLPEVSPELVVNSAVSSGGIGLAYSYNEPAVWYEFMIDMAMGIEQAGLKNVVVTNGYINSEPLEELMDVAHAFNTDLKGFSDEFYRKWTGAKLQKVLGTLKSVARRGLHQEITFLVIPGLNDDPELFLEMVRWIAGELGNRTVLHINRYFPAFQLHLPPTPIAALDRLLNIGRDHLEFVYPGNLHTNGRADSDTRCPACRNLLIERKGYNTQIQGMDAHGCCNKCGERVIIYS